MKLKLDENLPGELVQALSALGHEVHTVQQEGLTGKDDAAVLAEAIREGRALVTQDLDFSDIASSSRAVMLVSCSYACGIPVAVGWPNDSNESLRRSL